MDRPQAPPTSRTAILIACWNHLATTTLPCTRALRTHTGEPYRALCVDNASDDATPRYLRRLARLDERFTYLRSPDNRGWAGGSLLALAALADEAYLCLLNSDVLVTPGWLGRLRARLDADEGLTAVLPVERPPDAGAPPARVAAAGADPAAMEPGTRPAPPPPPMADVLAAAARVERGQRGRTRPADPSGFCLLLRRRDEGLLRRYLADFDRYRTGELDWRALWNGAGARAVVALDTYVFHARGGSGGYYAYERGRSL